jgi:voltage-gated potassium channel
MIAAQLRYTAYKEAAEVTGRPNLRAALLLFIVLIGVGTVGFMLTEGWSPGQALFAAVTTLTTLGTDRPRTPAGMAFTIVFVLVGVGTSFYVITSAVVFVAEGHFTNALEKRRMERAIEQLRSHFIICGFGRVGRQIASEFDREGVSYILVDSSKDSLAHAIPGQLAIEGNPASDEVLLAARLAVARGLIAATDSNADNVYITLTARVLRRDLFILARANHPDAEAKLIRAGADRVISPYSVGGRLMAMLSLRPLSVEFVDTVLHNKAGDLLLEDVHITNGSPLAGLTLAEVRERYMTAVGILAVKSGDQVLLNPLPEIRLSAGDSLAVIGTAPQLALLENAAMGIRRSYRDE